MRLAGFIDGGASRSAARSYAACAWVMAVLMLALPAAVLAKGDGEAAIEKLQAQKALIDDPKIASYVRSVGERIVAHSDCAGTKFHFYVLDDDSLNAASTGDAYIMVHRGLLVLMRREDQLAFVLGHEIGHVCRQHSAQKKREAFLTNLLGFAGGFLTGSYDMVSTIQAYGGEQIVSLDRAKELEADLAGAIYMSRAGYDPDAVLEVMEAFKNYQLYGKKVTGQYEPYHGLLNDHPQDDVRLQQIIATARDKAITKEQEPVGDLLQQVEGITYGNAGAKGVVRGSRYFHGRLGFILEFPEKWTVSESPSKIVAYPPGGATAGYVAMQIDAAPEGLTPEKFIVKNTDGKPLTGGKKVEVKDEERVHEGYIAHLVGEPNTPGTTEVGVVFKDGRAHVFRAETRDPKMVEALRLGFRYAIDHLHTIKYADLKEANTERIVLYEARPGDTYEELVKATVLKDNPVEELRLLNGDYPVGQPRAGDRIKLVR